jgi:hypothetical protein
MQFHWGIMNEVPGWRACKMYFGTDEPTKYALILYNLSGNFP